MQLELFIQPEVDASAATADLHDGTDPCWVEKAAEVWNDPARLYVYMRGLELMILDEQEIPLAMRDAWEEHRIHDLKDSVRVISARLKQLSH